MIRDLLIILGVFGGTILACGFVLLVLLLLRDDMGNR